MSSLTYTASELLDMRPYPAKREVHYRLEEKLKKDCALGDILRLRPPHTLPLIEEEPRHAYAENSNAIKRDTVQQFDGTNSESKCCGLSNSEHIHVQSTCATAAQPTQRNEGFKRFYKAVVSPTHVRVTAGGRIVPNTRAPLSPTSKWNKEKNGVDEVSANQAPHREMLQANQFVFQSPQYASYSHYPPMLAGYPYPQPINPAVSMPPPYPMSAWQLGLNVPAQFGLHPASYALSRNSTVHREASSLEQESEDTRSENSTPSRIPLPQRFDPARSCFMNGHWMIPSHGTYVPYGMAPVPAYTHPAVLGARMAAQSLTAAASSNLQGGGVDPATNTASFEAPSGTSQSITASNPVSGLPFSSIRPSAITKNQLLGLRENQRWIESQLQFNRHQIDEKAFEQQAQLVRAHIEQFEENLKSQVAYEEIHYPKQNEPSRSCESSLGASKSVSSTSGDVKPVHSKQTDGTKLVRSSTGADTSKCVKAKSPIRFDTAVKRIGDCSSASSNSPRPTKGEPELAKKHSALPVNAALAPPFQPRAETGTPLSTIANLSVAATPNSVGNESSSGSLHRKDFPHDEAANRPYLIGKLRMEVDKEEGGNIEYDYPRKLTVAEQRARYMYWGNTPSHLQRGLPKFDGKDFYPPSPHRGRSPASSYADDHSTSSSPTHERAFHPFRSLGRGAQRPTRNCPGQATQSESLPRLEQQLCDLSVPAQKRPESCKTHVDRAYNDFRQALAEPSIASSKSSKEVVSSDEGDDDVKLLFKGRKSMTRVKPKSRNDIWQNMLRKGKSSANVIPGTVSSTTAQGFLPLYSGHATAHLVPTLGNGPVLLPRRQSPKAGDEVQTENMPPIDA